MNRKLTLILALISLVAVSISIATAVNDTQDELTADDTIDLDLVLNGTTFLSAQGTTTERFKSVMHPNVFLNFAQNLKDIHI